MGGQSPFLDGGYSPNLRPGVSVEGNEKRSSRLVGGRYIFHFLLKVALRGSFEERENFQTSE